MELELLKDVLFYSWIFNLAIMFLWVGLMAFARNWVHKMHGVFFPMPIEKFNELHYLMFGHYKLAILIFSFAPWLGLKIVL